MTTQSKARRRPGGRSLLTPWTVTLAATALALAVVLAAGVTRTGPVGDQPPGAIVRTGEQNAMGMPVIETPGAATGAASAGTVEVTGAEWALGTVPLNTAVRPTWRLRNTGTEPVTVGEPHAEVLEGCCPGPFTIDRGTIPPGGEAMLAFELSMHPGMDGWHDLAVHVPVVAGATEDVLALRVTGDFRGA